LISVYAFLQKGGRDRFPSDIHPVRVKMDYDTRVLSDASHSPFILIEETSGSLNRVSNPPK
jgi:hypothetical protein